MLCLQHFNLWIWTNPHTLSIQSNSAAAMWDNNTVIYSCREEFYRLLIEAMRTAQMHNCKNKDDSTSRANYSSLVSCPYKHKTMSVLYNRFLYLSCCLLWQDTKWDCIPNEPVTQPAYSFVFIMYQQQYFIEIIHPLCKKAEITQLRKMVLLNNLNKLAHVHWTSVSTMVTFGPVKNGGLHIIILVS